jgi:hypothetical protein
MKMPELTWNELPTDQDDKISLNTLGKYNQQMVVYIICFVASDYDTNKILNVFVFV